MSADVKTKVFKPFAARFIPVYLILIAILFFVIFNMRKASHPAPHVAAKPIIDRQNLADAKIVDTVQRGLKEEDKSPLIQWIERTRIDNKINSHCVILIPEKRTNGHKFIFELSDFLKSKGYEVSQGDTESSPNEILGISFSARSNCVALLVGTI